MSSPSSGDSREVLRWWAENEVEEHWNAGVFDLALVLRLTSISRADAAIKIKSSHGENKGFVNLGLRLGGQVKDVDQSRIIRNRFGPGPAKVVVKVRAIYRGTLAIEEIEPIYPYPPEVPCEDYRGELVPRADYCYEP